MPLVSQSIHRRSRVAVSLGVLALTTALVMGLPIAPPTAHAAAGCSSTTPAMGVTVTCNTAGSETITVPAGAVSVEVVANGGGGAGGGKNSSVAGASGGAGASGAKVQTTLPVTGTSSLTITVGAGGVPTGLNDSGKGGGSTRIASGSTFLLVAGGGGGGGAENGGSDGGAGGSGGQSGASGGGVGGQGGNVSSAGAGGSGGTGVVNSGTSSFEGVGGPGYGPSGNFGGWGGDGYGGGGGGGNVSIAFGGGGGGGSYVTPAASSVVITDGGGGAGGIGASANTSPAANGSAGSVTLTFFSPPDAPTGVTATAESGQATVSWTAPASTGGSAVTNYTVTSNPGALTFSSSGAATSLTAAGLTNGTSYTFTVTATNVAGTSSASSASNAVTPVAPPSPPSPQPDPSPEPTTSPQPTPQSNSPTALETPPSPIPPPALSAGQSSGLVGGQSVVVNSNTLPGGGTSLSVAGAIIEALPQNPSGANSSTAVTQSQQSREESAFRPGGEVDVKITGLAPASKVSVYLYSQPTLLGILDVDANGSVIGSVPIPPSVASGDHTLQFTGWLPNGDALVVSTPISLSDAQRETKRTLYFDYGSVSLRASAKKNLATLVRQVSTWPQFRTTVVGFQRTVGAKPADIRRARERATNVARYLRAIGMPGPIRIAHNGRTSSNDHSARKVTVTVNGS